ncbi:MAG: hypothetical protein ACYDAD_06570 [Acidimicrobiales bacterium]
MGVTDLEGRAEAPAPLENDLPGALPAIVAFRIGQNAIRAPYGDHRPVNGSIAVSVRRLVGRTLERLSTGP